MDGMRALSHKRIFFMAKTPAFLSIDCFNINDINRLGNDFIRPQPHFHLYLSSTWTHKWGVHVRNYDPSSLTHTCAHKRHRALSWPLPRPPNGKDPVKPSWVEEEGGVEWNRGAKEQTISDALVWERGDQTYLSCRKTVAPPKRPPSPCLWPGPWAATCTCQSREAPYLERGK